ncbi:hypothetical protein [Photobacterium leiognathi]|uniref:hypothetical protein n=1 Tax=Photobacterium leiognathi TaxID=553611 RepID=UPI0011B1EED5|nr:hypothetical protein [Photobacterium leiognathi]
MMKASHSFFSKMKQTLLESIEYKSRIWVININKNGVSDGSNVISEDSFSSPLSWMVKSGYSPSMLKIVDEMKRSETTTIMLENETHHLMRVK